MSIKLDIYDYRTHLTYLSLSLAGQGVEVYIDIIPIIPIGYIRKMVKEEKSDTATAEEMRGDAK